MRSRDRSWSVCKPSWSMWSDRCSVSRSGSRGSVGSSPNELYAYAPAEWLRLPAVPLFEDTFSHFLIPSNSSYSFRSAAHPHLVVCFSSNRPSLLSFTFLSCVTWRSYPFEMCSQNMQFFCCFFARRWHWLGEVCLNVGRVKDLVKSMIKWKRGRAVNGES